MVDRQIAWAARSEKVRLDGVAATLAALAVDLRRRAGDDERLHDVLAAALDRSEPAVREWVHPVEASALAKWARTYVASPPVEGLDALPMLAAELRAGQRDRLLAAMGAAEVDDPRWLRAAALVAAGRLPPAG